MAFHVAGFVKLAYLMPDCHECAYCVRTDREHVPCLLC